MSREEKIEEYLKQPVKVGDLVDIRGRGVQGDKAWGNSAEVLGVINERDVVVESEYYKGKKDLIQSGNWRKNTRFIGEDPMVEKPWNSNLQMVAFGLGSIINALDEDDRYENWENSEYIHTLSWNPTIVDDSGNEVEYQRDFVWTLEQKQNLIESIYNYINIGTIVVRKRPYEYVANRAKQKKEVAFFDIVDGKQRLDAIFGFVKNEFCDLQGRYYRDFSRAGQSRFEDFRQLGYGELGESSTDQDVKNVFLGINVEGTPMSTEHIEFVKSINLK